MRKDKGATASEVPPFPLPVYELTFHIVWIIFAQCPLAKARNAHHLAGSKIEVQGIAPLQILEWCVTILEINCKTTHLGESPLHNGAL